MPTSASERNVRRRGAAGTSTSLGTTNTGHPASSAAAVPVTESSIARHRRRIEAEQLGGPLVDVGCGLARAAPRRRRPMTEK